MRATSPSRLFLFLLLLVGVSFRLVYAAERSSNYLWPTDASRALTSSFGEYRPGHFHAGIDIKTWGRTGYKVFAVRDGYIWKVRVSPFGYGKVVYQVLDTGEIAVYAHLSRFMPSLETRVRRVQRRKHRYSVTLVFKRNQMPVRKGQVIAYTGDTGVGYPHLHFELRDSRNRPINPLLRGFRVVDHQAPRIKAVAVTPLASWARVDGDAAPVTRKVASVQGHQVGLDRPLQIWGPVYLAVLASDGTDAVRNRISVYALRLYLDGELVYSCRYNRFSYAETGLVDLDRDYRLRVRTHDIYYALYVAPENTLPFHADFGPGSGVIWAGAPVRPVSALERWLDRLTGARVLEPGTHEARIVAEDFEGNRAEARVELRVVPPAQQIASLNRIRGAAGPGDARQAAPDLTARLHLSLDRYETYARIVVTSDRPLVHVPTIAVRGRRTSLLQAWLVDDTTAVAVWPYPNRDRVEATISAEVDGAKRTSRVRLYRITADGQKSVKVQTGAAEITFPAGSGYRTFFASAEEDTDWAVNPVPWPFSTPVRLEPEDVPLRRRVTLRYRLSAPLQVPLQRLAWYYRAPDRWAFVGNRLDSSRGEVEADVKGFGTFAVVPDTVPPVVEILWPRQGSRTTRRQPRIRVRIADSLSGIGGEDDFEVLLDGEKLVAEWDPERGTLRCYPDQPLSLGAHTLEVRVHDRCYNESWDEATFQVVRPRRQKTVAKQAAAATSNSTASDSGRVGSP